MLRAPIILSIGLGAGFVALGAGCGPAATAEPAAVTVTGTTTTTTIPGPTAVPDAACGYCTIDGRVLPDCDTTAAGTTDDVTTTGTSPQP